MDTDVQTYFSFERPPFTPTTNSTDIFHAKSRTKLVEKVVDEVLAGCDVLTVRGGRGVGKTSLAHLLDMALHARGFTPIHVDGASDQPFHVQDRIGQAGCLLAGDADAPTNTETWDARRVQRLVLLIDNADATSSVLFRYFWLLIENRRLTATKIHLIFFGAVGSWAGLEPPDLDRLRRACSSCYLLNPLEDGEVAAYLDYKLRRAGRTLKRVMTRGAVSELIERSRCVPAELDELTASALARSRRQGLRRVTRGNVHPTASDHLLTVAPAPQPAASRMGKTIAFLVVAFAGLAAGGTVGWMTWQRGSGTLPVATYDRTQLAEIRVRAAPALVKTLALSAPEPMHVAGQPAEPIAESTAAPALGGPPRHQAGPGLVLVAAAGDDLPGLYARVYRGVPPPPYADVVAANTVPVRPGSLVIFPEPPLGWQRR